MDTSAKVSGRSKWRVPALLILLSLVPAIAGTSRLLELARGAAITAANERFFAMPVPVVLHILAVIPFSILGALQFVPALRSRRSGWHRIAGRVLAPLGLVAVLSGLWMTQFYSWPEGDGIALYFLRLGFGFLMLISLLLGIEAIRQRDFVSHGHWMLRAYAIGMGAGTQVLTHLPWFILVGKPDESTRAVLMGAAWVINLAVAEWVIRGGRSPRRLTAELAA
jgi:uncharacterized membrane protein